MKVPFVDLKAQYKAIKKEINQAIQDTIDDTAFIMGQRVADFEKNFAKYCNIKHAVGVSSGTSSLHLAMRVLGLKRGDEVITVPNTFIATIQYIDHLGGKIKFVDIDLETYLIDTNKIEEAITQKTKIILPVHLFGQMCDMKTIKDIAEDHDLKILEDAAQAHGAEFNGGAYGDAGAVTTNNEEYASKIAQLRDHGRFPGEKYIHAVPGFNERLDTLQASILNVKLKYLNKWNDMRRKNARQYNILLKDSDIITPYEQEHAKHVYHLYVVRTKNRDKLQKYLKENGIATGVHYPVPLHLQPAYKHLNLKEWSFPQTEKAAKEVLSLPMYPELSKEQIEYVVEKIQSF